LSNAWPSAEKSPVSDNDAPMVIGPLGLLVAAGLLLELLLVQAASMLTPATRTALLANAFQQNRGCTGLTPSSSFLGINV
jgi:hypothetical protein